MKFASIVTQLKGALNDDDLFAKSLGTLAAAAKKNDKLKNLLGTMSEADIVKIATNMGDVLRKFPVKQGTIAGHMALALAKMTDDVDAGKLAQRFEVVAKSAQEFSQVKFANHSLLCEI